VESQANQGTFDPELDLMPRRPTRRHPERLPPYQRLIVNPLLVVLSWLIVFAVIRISVANRNMIGFLVAISQMVLSILLVQYHCLDCGKTGWLMGYRSHACPAVAARWGNRLAPPIRGPGVGAQLALWFMLLAGGLILVLIVVSK
jgi:hypothetical protein